MSNFLYKMASNYNIYFSILAAGKGTRMNSDLPKVMHEVADTPMIKILLDNVSGDKSSKVSMVVSDEGEVIKDFFGIKSNISFVLQRERLGTAHAVKESLKGVKDETGALIVLYGDTPFIEKETIDKLKQKILDGNSVVVTGFYCNHENQYGKLVTESNDLLRIVEDKEASLDEKKIKLCNSGVMAIDLKHAKKLIAKIDNNNLKQEYYLTDIVEIARGENLKVSFITVNETQVQGINNKKELAIANSYYQNKLRDDALFAGVTMLDPKTVYLSREVEFGRDVILEQNVIIKGKVKIGNGVKIRANSYLEDAEIGDGCIIGPYARVRPGTVLERDVKIGNFVEIKNSQIKQGSKVNHLSYIGDAMLHENVNVGAGTITCNYDGYNKYETEIEKGAFIGSNSALVAPVKIAEGSIVGAGSVITKNNEKDSIVVSRAKQILIKNGASKFRNEKKKT
jgi:bifunctional UDP-N-acetylglucosamine pyrophosphorylase/glucosamine-1-phosphate N-acetyltransferase